jgi:septal ring factor EnvC (AmiA/AmiB activator)
MQECGTRRADSARIVRVSCISAFLHFCISVFLLAQAPDRARTEALARRAGDRLVALQREADRLASDERSLLNDLRKLEVERQIKTEELKQAEAEVATIQEDLDATAAKVDALQAAEAAARPELRSRLVEIYKLGQARYARLLLSTPDLRRIGQASRTVAALAQLDRDRIARHEQMLKDLDATRATLETRKKTAVAARATAEQAHAAVQKASLAKSNLVREIDSRRDLNAQVSAELQTAQVRLQTALRDSPNASAGEIPALPLKPFKGDLVWPATGQLRRRFGGTSGLPAGSSNGIEIGTDDGAAISAVHDGVVAFAGTFSGFGNLIILDHGSQTFSLYGDLLDFSVAKGARVDRGQQLGSAGPLPSGGTGMYFELRVDGRPVDPLQWLRKASQP